MHVAPLPPQTAYVYFCKEFRPQIAADLTDRSGCVPNFVDVGRVCNDRWKLMSHGERARFEEMASADRARYDTEVRAPRASTSSVDDDVATSAELAVHNEFGSVNVLASIAEAVGVDWVSKVLNLGALHKRLRLGTWAHCTKPAEASC